MPFCEVILTSASRSGSRSRLMARKSRAGSGALTLLLSRAAGPEVQPEDLPERLRWVAEAATRPQRKEEAIVLDEFLGRIERELIRRALARAKGNKARAARLLGLTRPRLYRRMVQLGLEGAGPQ